MLKIELPNPGLAILALIAVLSPDVATYKKAFSITPHAGIPEIEKEAGCVTLSVKLLPVLANKGLLA